MPQAVSGRGDGGKTLAYAELHELTGGQGRLKHVRCLELGRRNP